MYAVHRLCAPASSGQRRTPESSGELQLNSEEKVGCLSCVCQSASYMSLSWIKDKINKPGWMYAYCIVEGDGAALYAGNGNSSRSGKV